MERRWTDFVPLAGRTSEGPPRWFTDAYETWVALSASLVDAGWVLSDACGDAARSSTCVAARQVTRGDDAAQLLAGALVGAGVLASGDPGLPVVQQVLADLDRLGPLRRLHEPVDLVPAPRSLLNEQQLQLLDGLADGLTTTEVAAVLHVSRRTAVRRLAAAQEQLGVRSLTRAVLVTRASAAGAGPR